jgi:WD40 repeat protein
MLLESKELYYRSIPGAVMNECANVNFNNVNVYDVYSSSGHSDYVRSVAISADGTKVVSGSDDKTVKIWDVESGDVLHTLSGEKDRDRDSEYDDESV